MGHLFVSEDEGVSCLVCGAHYGEERIAQDEYEGCSGRTDLVHPVSGDASSHSLDGCADFDARGDCAHIAHGCDCDRCRS